MNNLEIKNVNIGQIHGYERNARNHPESQIKQIRKSITEFGFNNTILIDEHGEIIAGHGRYIAAKQMGLSTVPSDPKANHIPFIPEDEIVSVPGDIWQFGPHRIICGNSLEESTFNQLMGGAVADTVLQDPPYNVKINGHVCGSGAIHHKVVCHGIGRDVSGRIYQFPETKLFSGNFIAKKMAVIRIKTKPRQILSGF